MKSVRKYLPIAASLAIHFMIVFGFWRMEVPQPQAKEEVQVFVIRPEGFQAIQVNQLVDFQEVDERGREFKTSSDKANEVVQEESKEQGSVVLKEIESVESRSPEPVQTDDAEGVVEQKAVVAAGDGTAPERMPEPEIRRQEEIQMDVENIAPADSILISRLSENSVIDIPSLYEEPTYIQDIEVEIPEVSKVIIPEDTDIALQRLIESVPQTSRKSSAAGEMPVEWGEMKDYTRIPTIDASKYTADVDVDAQLQLPANRDRLIPETQSDGSSKEISYEHILVEKISTGTAHPVLEAVLSDMSLIDGGEEGSDHETSSFGAAEIGWAGRKRAVRKWKKPEYPEQLQAEGHEFDVSAVIVVSPAGNVVSVQITDSSGYPDADANVERTLRSYYLFEESRDTKNDTGTITFQFRLGKRD